MNADAGGGGGLFAKPKASLPFAVSRQCSSKRSFLTGERCHSISTSVQRFQKASARLQSQERREKCVFRAWENLDVRNGEGKTVN